MSEEYLGRIHSSKRNLVSEEDLMNKQDFGELSSSKKICLEETILSFIPRSVPLSIADQFLLIEQNQCRNLQNIQFTSPVDYIYNPLEYAFQTHSDFIYRFCNSEKKVLFLGMNPGPFGMAQNGVPFGEGSFVRDWFQIKGQVFKPSREHPKRKIDGLKCTRSEVSGNRFWSLFKSLCKTPENFFKDCFVHNVCALMFMKTSSKNVTPPQLKMEERKKLMAVCNESLCATIQLLNIKLVIGVGKFAASTAAKAIQNKTFSHQINIESIMHPSPINPTANKGWDLIAKKALKNLNILNYTNWTELNNV